MSEKWEAIREWARGVQDYSPLPWDRMPEIELYMDQVITYMEKQLVFYRRNEQSKTLTPSMINNYVKDALLPRPDKKRYSREHLAALMMICLMKPVLSIPDVELLSADLHRSHTTEEIYGRFLQTQNRALREVAERLLREELSSEEDLCRMAMQLTLEANACRIAAERLLEAMDRPEELKKKEKASRKEAGEEAPEPAEEKTK